MKAASLEASQQVRYSGRPEVPIDERAVGEEVLSGHAHEIVPGLYLGSHHAVGSLAMGPALAKLGVTAILNCTTDKEVPCLFQEKVGTLCCEYARVGIHDNDTAQIVPYLEGGANFIARHIETGKVIVHCMRGVSRSASLVMAFLIQHRGMTRDQAYILTKQKRPVVNPNPGFWRQLGQFEISSRQVTKEPLPLSFDGGWCRQSMASFSMLGSQQDSSTAANALRIIFPIGEDPSWNRHTALAAGLDFVLSRGLAPSDIDWLRALCCACDNKIGDDEIRAAKKQKKSNNPAEEHRLPSKGVDILRSIIFDDPEFLANWECEIRRSKFSQLLKDVGWVGVEDTKQGHSDEEAEEGSS